MRDLKHRRSKRVTTRISTALVFVMASAFLVIGSPAHASALDSPKNTALFTEPQVKSPLVENNLKIDELKVEVKTKAQEIEEKKDDVQKVQEEAEAALKQKNEAASTVEGLRAQIADLQARLAEKKRLEALRIVTVRSYASDAGGNLYAPGNCTWYVKQKRPDIGNQWGNANSWYASAQAQGFKTGTMAKTGAIGVSFEGYYGHVVYVERWNGNGTVDISEMNYGGLYNMNYRTVPESEFLYIYERT